MMRIAVVAVAAAVSAAAVPLWRRADAPDVDATTLARVHQWLARRRPSLWDENWDGMMEEDRPTFPFQPRITRYVYLIRHGQFLPSTKGLTELGRSQAALTGARLQLLDRELHFDRMVHSSALRAQETADIIHRFLPRLARCEDNLLVEGTPCMPDYPIRDRTPDWIFRDSARVEAAFRRYFFRPPETQLRDSHELIVCHANVIRFFVCRALQLPPERWLGFSVDHCSLCVLAVDDRGRVHLDAFSEAGHLPPAAVTRHNAVG